ncbi:MAG TPA: response regulator [Candidatus Goldiibacteriota bacterium]|nr:response regulator [Candidatus Goldiibacteriota bacterium]
MNKLGTILVVDDEPAILSALVDTLEDDYTVLTATNGKEALALLDKKLPDLIISDVSMPQMDGLEFLTNLKKKGLGVKIPLIFLSAKGQVADVEKGVNLGAYGYIVKPFLPTRLLEKVEEVFVKLEARKKMKKG